MTPPDAEDLALLLPVPDVTAEHRARALLTYILEPSSPLASRVRAGDVLDVAEGLLAGDFEGHEHLVATARQRVAEVDIDAVLHSVRSRGGMFIIPGDAAWPTQLDDLPEPPLGLWCRGSAPLRLLAATSVSMVGARACTGYGQRLALTMAAALAERGFPIVSGGAFGIDAAAHRGALSSGRTVCVLASGVDAPYPASHAPLFDQIASTGVLISEVPPHEPARKFRFLSRNRIIAALSRGTVVVEASLRSGSLGTARRARDIGRPVMVVPGPVTSHASSGCHELLRHDPEAILVTCAEDVLDVVGDIGADAVGWRSGPVIALDGVSDTAKRVHDYLATPMTPAQAAVAAGVTAAEAMAAIMELASHRLIERRGEQPAVWRAVANSGSRR